MVIGVTSYNNYYKVNIVCYHSADIINQTKSTQYKTNDCHYTYYTIINTQLKLVCIKRLNNVCILKCDSSSFQFHSMSYKKIKFHSLINYV